MKHQTTQTETICGLDQKIRKLTSQLILVNRNDSEKRSTAIAEIDLLKAKRLEMMRTRTYDRMLFALG